MVGDAGSGRAGPDGEGLLDGWLPHPALVTMARWPRGEAEIERLLSLKHLQAATGAAANGRPLLDKAHRTLRRYDDL
jgi:hypothetical protein